MFDLSKTKELFMFILFALYRAVQFGSIIFIGFNSFQVLMDQPFVLIAALFILFTVVVEWAFYWVMTLVW